MKSPYTTQQQAISETLKNFEEGKRKIINIQSCGLGKTELSAWISQKDKGKYIICRT